jgi:hypothetical protein
MRLSFIGCPCSGKTTTAAMTAARLKEVGVGCEFVVEQARLYIAEKRRSLKLKPTDSLALNDDDQIAIMQKQLYVEGLMADAVGDDVILVTDSSPLNSLLYMSPSVQDRAVALGLVQEAIDTADLVFYVPPVQQPDYLDPNRIHDKEASLRIDLLIPFLMDALAPSVWKKAIRVDGPPASRLNQVTAALMSRRLG